MGRAPSSAPSRSTIEFIFLAHFFLELGLGLLKLRGKYAGFDAPAGMERFARHHGVSLLSLALAGWLIYRQRLAFSAAGVVAALVLCAFHSGAVAVMLADGAILWSNSLGLRTVTLPELSIAAPRPSRRRRKASSRPGASPVEPTRWELDYRGSIPPTLDDCRSAATDIDRRRLAERRRAYLEHCRVVHARVLYDRTRYDPPPF